VLYCTDRQQKKEHDDIIIFITSGFIQPLKVWENRDAFLEALKIWGKCTLVQGLGKWKFHKNDQQKMDSEVGKITWRLDG